MCECNEDFYKTKNTRHVDTCVNINECDGSSFDNVTAIHNCDKNADCIDLIGGFECYCWEGFEGTGVFGDCHNIDECSFYEMADGGAG